MVPVGTPLGATPMPSLSRSLALAGLAFTLTACQTYEATYVETPRVRRSVVVERSYDPFYEPTTTTVYRERRVYRDPFDDPYAPVYREPRYDPYARPFRERRFERDYVAPRPPVGSFPPPNVVTGPVYRNPPVVSGPVYRGAPPVTSGPVYRGAQPAATSGPVYRGRPDGTPLPPGTPVPIQRDESGAIGR